MGAMQSRRDAAMVGGNPRLAKAMRECRPAFWTMGGLSFVINALMLAPPIYMLQVYNRVLGTGRIETLVLLTLMVAGALALLGVLESMRAVIGARVGKWLEQSLAPSYLRIGIEAGTRGENGCSESLRSLATLRGFVSSPSLGVFFDFPWVPIYILVIALLHPMLGTLALVSAVAIAILALANEMLTRRLLRDAADRATESNQNVDTAVRNADAVEAMGMTDAIVARWRMRNATASESSGRAAERSGVLLGLVKFVRAFVQMAILGLGAYLVVANELTAGAMIAASILLGRALAPVEQSVGAWRQFSNARTAYHRLRRTLGAGGEDARTILPQPIGYLDVLNVTVIPFKGRSPILREVGFDAKPGEALAVIGPSASGKSTLCRLLIGLHEPTFGEIRLDGSTLRHWNREQLGQHIGYLPQDTELFSGTVRENIARMGEPDDNAVIEAAKLAHAHGMIQQLPEGYDTLIGDGGLKLSGGQRQRIGLARAVYGDPRVVVLDEPNSNLDQQGEAALSAAIKQLKERNVTLVIVGHRPSTLAEADRVLLLEAGRVRMIGPRDEIIARLRGRALEEASPKEESDQGDAVQTSALDGRKKTPAVGPKAATALPPKQSGRTAKVRAVETTTDA